MEVPQKTKSRANIQFRDSTPFYKYIQRNVRQDAIEPFANSCLLNLFTITNLWKQSRYPTTDE
jgi:hypothetical protein